MPIATQLNLALDNEIGVLARLCRDLAHGGVNLLAISAPEKTREKGSSACWCRIASWQCTS